MSSIHFFALVVIVMGLFCLYLAEDWRKNTESDRGTCSTIFGTASVLMYRDKSDVIVTVHRKDGGWMIFEAPPHAKAMLERTAKSEVTD